MSKKKFYVVWNGRTIGVFHDWLTCEEQVKGYPDAMYKSFETLIQAEEAFFNEYENYIGIDAQKPKLSLEVLERIGKPIINSICVDASFNGATKIMEYRGIDYNEKKQVFLKGPYESATNNIGEFLAIVHALAWMQNEKDTRPIYSDSITAIAWVKRKKINSKLVFSQDETTIGNLVLRAESWLQKNAYPNAILKWETQAWGENPADFGRK